jgi:hypothetical protein
MPHFTLETVKRIYDERFPKEYLEIGLDADTGELIEIRSCMLNELTQNFDIIQRVVIHPDSMDLVIQALESFRKPTTH